MAPFKIVVHGEYRLVRQPELASVVLYATADGRSQESVSEKINNTFKGVQAAIKDLLILDEQNRPTEASPIMQWSVLPIICRSINLRDHGSPQTNQSHAHGSAHGNSQPNPPDPSIIHRAMFFMEVRFRDFAKLREFVNGLARTPVIQVHHIQWTLSNASTDISNSTVRTMAFRDAINKANFYAKVLSREVVPVEARARRTEVTMRFNPMVQAPLSSEAASMIMLLPQYIEFKHRVKVTFSGA